MNDYMGAVFVLAGIIIGGTAASCDDGHDFNPGTCYWEELGPGVEWCQVDPMVCYKYVTETGPGQCIEDVTVYCEVL